MSVNATIPDIVHLIELYGHFLEAHPKGELKDFGLYLIQHAHQADATEDTDRKVWPEPSEVAPNDKVVDHTPTDHVGTTLSPDLAIECTFLMAKLSSYVEVWVKEAFRDLPLLSQGDYTILKIVHELQSPTKKEIYLNTIMERTTCNESIKRLTREGLFREEVDQADRRQRRVSLTAKGEALLQVATDKILALSRLFLGPIPPDAMMGVYDRLTRIVGYHDHLYQGMERTDLRKKFNL
ncbi:MAG: MarR family winged helix-turn-helix transcriptional regulator [Bacteroidota bacterium]